MRLSALTFSNKVFKNRSYVPGNKSKLNGKCLLSTHFTQVFFLLICVAEWHNFEETKITDRVYPITLPY